MLSRAARVVVVVALAALGLVAAGCHSHSSSHAYPVYHDLVFTVDNFHGDAIWIEAVDWDGIPEDFGTVYDGERVDFVVSDYWEGKTLRARCECDGSIIDFEYAYDGLHWDVF
jgi:hypothetical protein